METTKITTIDSMEDLNREKAQLRNEVEQHRKSISSNIEGIKEDLSPVRRVAQLAGSMFEGPGAAGNNFVQTVAGTAVDMFLFRFLLRRSPLLVKLIVPVLVKNVVGGYIARHQSEWADKLSVSMRKWSESRRNRLSSRPPLLLEAHEAYLPTGLTGSVEPPDTENAGAPHANLPGMS